MKSERARMKSSAHAPQMKSKPSASDKKFDKSKLVEFLAYPNGF